MATNPTSVNNPTNAKFIPGQSALPFIRKESQSKTVNALVRTKASFNDGKDYPDEGAPLMTGDSGEPNVRRFAPVAKFVNVIDTPTQAEMEAFAHPDETSQTQVKYLKEAIIMDIDAKLIVSTDAQMKRGIFREAHFPTLPSYLNSQYYKKMRESQMVSQAISGSAEITKLRESSKPVGIRFNPKLVHLMKAADKSVLGDIKSKKLLESIKKFREDNFSMDTGRGTWGGDVDAAGTAGLNWDSGQNNSLPLIGGPWSKQLYMFDYLDMHSKAWDASTHNPVAKRILNVITQFVLGKGVKLTVTKAIRLADKLKAEKQAQQPKQTADQGGAKSGPGQQAAKASTIQVLSTKAGDAAVISDYKEAAQETLDRHWRKNGMHLRSKLILHDLLTFGEQFIRYFDASWGLKVRQIDPSTVWEVVTDPDDCENEFYIHQQYQTRYMNLFDSSSAGNIPMMKYIIRQVPSQHYYHMKINATAGEVRGRSDLFAILGWLKRLKEYASDRVIRNKMANLFVLDVSVDGDQAAVNQIQAQMTATPPQPGGFFFHNKAAELNGIKAEVGAGDSQADYQMLMQIIAMGAGVSQEYLGMGGSTSKASSLVGTEPDIKTFEDHQERMEKFFDQDSERVFDRAKEMGELPQDLLVTIEATYPSLAEENRSEKLKDLAFGESMSWFSHRRIAHSAAKELQFTSYNYDDEQKEIAEEDANKEVLINTAYAQVAKGLDPAAAAPAGGDDGSGDAGSSGAGSNKMSKMGTGDSSNKAESSSSGESANVESLKEAHSNSGRTKRSTFVVGGDAPNLRWSGADTDKESGRKDHYRGHDPRDIAESIKREAANLRFRRRGVGRKHDRYATPDRKRDQKSLNRHDKIAKARKSLRSGNFNHESKRKLPTDPSIQRFPRL